MTKEISKNQTELNSLTSNQTLEQNARGVFINASQNILKL